MASVHLARLLGTAGFSRVVAIKRLHPHLARDPEFVSMFVDEARLAARVQHPNVVPTLDVVAVEGEIFIVMEYVEGESVARLNRIARDALRFPLPVVLSIVPARHGLHAAHGHAARMAVS
jgi:serine/threonine-protein kinase